MRRLLVFAFVLLHFASAAHAIAADYQIIDVRPGETVDTYFQINLSGKVYVRIETKRGPSCAEFWWIIWPFGTIKSLGRQCNGENFEIPGLSDFAFSSKLRAGGVAESTKLIVSASEAVARSITVAW